MSGVPVLKPISGHTKSVRAAIDYLTKKERALAADYVNCSETDRRGNPVWRQMDETRHALGCDTRVGGHKRVRTYEHFVLSPDPRDHVDLSTMRELAVAWAKEHFGSYQVAIYYHDDNGLRIPHAHLIVNNANLDRPGRVSTILTPKREAEMFRDLQRMAAERGLHAFTERPSSVNNAEWAKADRERKSCGDVTADRPKGTVQPTYTTRQDRELEAKGISWKADVRDRIACALRMSRTEGEFLEACRALRLVVRESSSRKGGGDWIYAHPGKDTWRVSGARLGRSWSRWGVQRSLASARARGAGRPSPGSRDRLLATLGSLERADGGMAMQVLGTTRGLDVTAADVTNVLDVCSRMDIRALSDFPLALREPMSHAERDRLRDAMRLARALGHLPRERDRVDGERSSYAQRRAIETRARGYYEEDGVSVSREAGKALPEAREELSEKRQARHR